MAYNDNDNDNDNDTPLTQYKRSTGHNHDGFRPFLPFFSRKKRLIKSRNARGKDDDNDFPSKKTTMKPAELDRLGEQMKMNTFNFYHTAAMYS